VQAEFEHQITDQVRTRAAVLGGPGVRWFPGPGTPRRQWHPMQQAGCRLENYLAARDGRDGDTGNSQLRGSVLRCTGVVRATGIQSVRDSGRQRPDSVRKPVQTKRQAPYPVWAAAIGICCCWALHRVGARPLNHRGKPQLPSPASLTGSARRLVAMRAAVAGLQDRPVTRAGPSLDSSRCKS